MTINQELCISCGACEAMCPGMECETKGFHKCVEYIDGQYVIDCENCKSCGECAKICPTGAIAKDGD